MTLKLLRILPLCGLLFACSQETAGPRDELLALVPADTPYAFAVGKELPSGLRERLADHYAMQLSTQGAALARVLEQMEAAEPDTPMALPARRLFEVLEAIFVEFEGRTTAAKLRELGIEPVPRSVIYGIGMLPVLRVEIADAAKLNALLDRVEQRVGVRAVSAALNGQVYRRVDLGQVDAVLAVTERHAIAGLLPDALFERDLPLLLGQQPPAENLADAGDIQALIERHRFTGHGEGFIKLDEMVATFLGKGRGRNAEVMAALGAAPLPLSNGCLRMSEALVAGMPRLVVGVTEAGERRLAARGIWESSPAVAAYLQKLAAPVPGVGAAYDGMLALGVGLQLPQLRNAIEALLRELIAAGPDCDWVDPDSLQALIPQLNLALGPMTAGIKGFNLQVADLVMDPDSLEPASVQAGLLAAVDDPRGMFALGAMFDPTLATLDIPQDGSFVDLPTTVATQGTAPPLKIAIRDKALLLLAGAGSVERVGPLVDAVAHSPAPLLAVDYGVHHLVERLGEVLEQTAARLAGQGEDEMAQGLLQQLEDLRAQAAIYDRLRVVLYASADGLVMDQVMDLR